MSYVSITVACRKYILILHLLVYRHVYFVLYVGNYRIYISNFGRFLGPKIVVTLVVLQMGR